MAIRELKAHIKTLCRNDRRKIHMRCAEEALGSWQFATAFVVGIPCMIAGGIALSKLDGFFGENYAVLVSAIYGTVLTSILSRQADRYLEKAYREFQQQNPELSPAAVAPDEA
jgi:hypothetical protein